MFCRCEIFSDAAVKAFRRLIEIIKDECLEDMQRDIVGVYEAELSLDHGIVLKACGGYAMDLNWKTNGVDCELRFENTEMQLKSGEDWYEEFCSLGHVGCSDERVEIYNVRLYVEGEHLIISYLQAQRCTGDCYKSDSCHNVYMIYDEFDRDLHHVGTRAVRVSENGITE